MQLAYHWMEMSPIDGDPSFLRSGGLHKLLEMKSLLCEVLFRVDDGRLMARKGICFK
jgi:hypothetical protein